VYVCAYVCVFVGHGGLYRIEKKGSVFEKMHLDEFVIMLV